MMCYVDVTIRIYDEKTIKKLQQIRKCGENITLLMQNAILKHETQHKKTKKAP